MFPSIYIFEKSIFLYDIMKNTGTIAGLWLFAILLNREVKFDKKIFLSFALSFIFSLPFAFLLRRFMEAENLEEFLNGTGSHFMGMVFAFYFIFPIIYKLILKNKPTDKIKGYSAVFFLVQHFFSRIGCFTLGCCFGKPYNGILSITFPYGTNPYMEYGKEVSIFPTQLFEAFSMAVILILVLICIKRKTNYAYKLFLITFSTVIFISEIFMYRYDYEITFYFTLPQLCAIFIMMCECFKVLAKKFKKLTFIMCMLFLLTSCGITEKQEKSANSENIIKIAVIGDAEYIDTNDIKAMNLAADDFFSKNNIKIETVTFDDSSDYNKAVECADEIANDSSISAVIVKQELDYIDASAEIFNNAKKPFIITNGCYEHTIKNGYDYMLVDCICAESAGKIMADWVIKNNYKNIAFCHSDTEFEEDELKGFQTEINNTDSRLADTVVGPYTQEEFDMAYSRWQTLGIDAVCISNYDILNSDVVRMLREKNSDIKVISDYVMDTEEDIEKNGKYLDGTAIVAMYISDFNKNDKKITERYFEKYGTEMSESAIQSYDIVNMVGEALMSENLSFMEYMKKKDGYKGISGRIAFDERGCLIPNENEVLIFKEGKFMQTK